MRVVRFWCPGSAWEPTAYEALPRDAVVEPMSFEIYRPIFDRLPVPLDDIRFSLNVFEILPVKIGKRRLYRLCPWISQTAGS